MTHQNKFIASQSILPGVTDGMVPLEEFPLWPEMMEVIPDTIDDNVLLAGKRAYALYCRFCHGIKGDGDGPVGRSYIPMPSDLRSDRIQNMTDAQLYNAMLGGIGHEMTTANDTLTILNRIVLPEYRWFIVEYVKSMGKGENRK
jgi:cytochrome c1